ncbi:MAG: GYD domain-containing protein [Chloroflexi bacterium]|nr:GYD domain-containing protein [Chloroflexota bacterium]
MPRYLFHGNYVGEGLKGLLKDGGSKRREAVAKLLEGMGGKVEAFYYAFGDEDVFVICDMPDNASAAALSLVVNASGAVAIKTTVLMTPEEVDEATKKTVAYRPPGQ